jgi:hypothetical protein
MKKVPFGNKKQSVETNAEEWIQSGQANAGETPSLKRLTLDIPADLHKRIKTRCAINGTKMVEEIRELLENHYRN